MNFTLGAAVFAAGVLAGVAITQGNVQKALDEATKRAAEKQSSTTR